MNQTIYFVALGCPKNRVDTERMIGIAQQNGLELVMAPEQADIIVVNTCGFILPAKEESVETVLELAEHKAGRCRALVMAGCLVQRYPAELAQELPEVDYFLGTTDLPQLQAILAGSGKQRRVCVSPPLGLAEEDYDRALVGSPHSLYLKISEGCDRRCAFCIIPQLRGRQRSRTVEALRQEATALAAAGAKELCLVAQDTTAYGRDLSPQVHLADLLQALDGVKGLAWIRVLYTYPSAVDDRLLQSLARLERVVPYLDLPLQHLDDVVLGRMHRGYRGDDVRALLERARRLVPGLFLRATLLCGHPGETPAAHRALEEFVGTAELDHLGVFAFSPEEGTDAAAQPDPVPEPLAQERAEQIIGLQRQVSQRRLARLRGQQLEVMVDGPSPESEYLLEGRHAGQAPEVDGVVVLSSCAGSPGERLQVRVTGSSDYDLVAEPLEAL